MPRNDNRKKLDSLNKIENKGFNKNHRKDPEYVVSKPMGLLDFLLLKITNQSRNNVKKILGSRCVLVDGAVVTQFDFQLAKGDVVTISSVPMSKGKNPVKITERCKLDIIHEDDDFIVVNKPSGLLSVATDKEKEKTAYRYLMDYVRAKNPRARIYVVHRLDKDTSGIFMVCKNEDLKNLMQDNWNNIVSKRGYYAVCEGKFKEKSGTVKSYLKETSTNIMYSSQNPHQGQLAITHYKVIKENLKYSLVDVNIDSGRKNQIRVHMGDLGHNIVGDNKYGNPSDPLNRLGLHAYELEFTHPITKQKMNFKAKIPSEFNGLLNK